MTSWIISMVLLVATGIGGGVLSTIDDDRNHDQTPDRIQLRDGSCQTSSLITFTQFNS